MSNSTKKGEENQKKHKQSTFDDRQKWHAEKNNLIAEIKGCGLEFSIEELAEKDLTNHKNLPLYNEIYPLKQDAIKLLNRRAELWAEYIAICELNKKHAVVHTGQTYILTEKIHPVFGGKDFSLEGRQSFKTYYEDEITVCADGKRRSKAEVWLKSSKRRKYCEIRFDPKMSNKESEEKKIYNLWYGFSREPKKGDCSRYWNHVKDNICSSDYEAYDFLYNWCAYVFQYPDKVHTCIVLIGSQGVGKNSFVEPLGVLLGSHYVPLSNIMELTSNFNSHLKNAVLIHGNEAFWGGHKKDIGMLKAMITEDICLIEGKGKDRIMVRNYKHIILSSNEEWPVHLDPDDRRFFVLRVSDAHKEDHAYFKAIKEELVDNGGYEALLYDLLNEDLTGFNPRKPPTTSYSFELKMRSANSVQRYVYDLLSEDRMGLRSKEIIAKIEVFRDYKEWCEDNSEKPYNNSNFGSELKKLIPSIRNTRPIENGFRVRSYEFPSFDKCRKEFCHSFKETDRIWNEEEV